MNVHSVISGRGKGRPRVDDKRRRILDAALETFAARGYHGTTVPEVAKAARVGTGTLYIYFATKEHLVNEVFRDAKKRLRAALIGDVPAGKAYRLDLAERWFADLWQRLGAFARAEPDAFRFLEMQDHAPYLDAESKGVELSVLAPLWLAGNQMHDRLAGVRVEVLIALVWGAFVGLVKAGRLGYLDVDERTLRDAGQTVWKMVAPRTWRATEPKPKKG
jgi:AcrR family transcriptional regulator